MASPIERRRGVVFHRVADDVGHLVVAAVLELAHGVGMRRWTGFEAVLAWGTARSRMHVAGLVEEPGPEHVVDVAGVAVQVRRCS